MAARERRPVGSGGTASPPSAMTGEMVLDHLQLQLTARSQPKSAGRFGRLLRRSMVMAWRADRRLFVVNTALQLSTAGLTAVQVFATKVVLDAILGAEGRADAIGRAIWPVLVLAGVMAFSTISAAVQQHRQRLLGELIGRAIREQILEISSGVELRAFESPTFYDQLQRVQTNAITRPLALWNGLIGVIGGLAGTVAVALAVVTLHPLLLPLLMLAGLPLFVSTRAGSRMEFQFAVRQVPRLRMRDYLFSVQTGRDEAKEVRSFRLAGALHARFAAVYDAYLAELREHVRRRTLLGLVSSISSSTLLAGTLLVLVWLVSRGDIGIAAAGAAVVAVRLLAQQLSGLFASSQQIFESGLFLDDLDDFLRLDVERDATGGASDVAPFNRLEVDGLSFRYPGATGPALQDVSFEIARGEVVALVGENGSGKSTLAKLLAALYRPDTGFIRWDGTDIATLDPGTIRDTIAVIFQDFVRYQLPARDNIAFGRADAPVSDARVDAAADTGGAIEFLRALPEGYETILSRSFKGGQDLSQGQWQRVALARAFYRDAPFVILDEPSSSLDPRAEHRLFASLRETLHGRTVLYVSHRMSTVREADRILVLHEGRLIESGRHEELLATGGRYAELFRLQAGAYLDPTP